MIPGIVIKKSWFWSCQNTNSSLKISCIKFLQNSAYRSSSNGRREIYFLKSEPISIPFILSNGMEKSSAPQFYLKMNTSFNDFKESWIIWIWTEEIYCGSSISYYSFLASIQASSSKLNGNWKVIALKILVNVNKFIKIYLNT